jgi:hypothetical protein
MNELVKLQFVLDSPALIFSYVLNLEIVFGDLASPSWKIEGHDADLLSFCECHGKQILMLLLKHGARVNAVNSRRQV